MAVIEIAFVCCPHICFIHPRWKGRYDWQLSVFAGHLPSHVEIDALAQRASRDGVIWGTFALTNFEGNPLVFALTRFKPKLVPVERPSFFEWRIVIFVMSPFDR